MACLQVASAVERPTPQAATLLSQCPDRKKPGPSPTRDTQNTIHQDMFAQDLLRLMVTSRHLTGSQQQASHTGQNAESHESSDLPTRTSRGQTDDSRTSPGARTLSTVHIYARRRPTHEFTSCPIASRGDACSHRRLRRTPSLRRTPRGSSRSGARPIAAFVLTAPPLSLVLPSVALD